MMPAAPWTSGSMTNAAISCDAAIGPCSSSSRRQRYVCPVVNAMATATDRSNEQRTVDAMEEVDPADRHRPSVSP